MIGAAKAKRGRRSPSVERDAYLRMFSDAGVSTPTRISHWPTDIDMNPSRRLTLPMKPARSSSA